MQTSASFYAGGRLGYAVHGTNIWTLGDERYPQGRYVFLITRVLEKTAVFASVIKEFLIQRLIDDGTIRDWSTLCFWSDTGTHFRSHRSLASAVCYIPERFKVHTRLCFSLECHAKSELDGYFGQINHTIANARSVEHLNSLADLVRVLRQDHADKVELGLSLPSCEFLEWLPDVEKKDVAKAPILPSSMPVKLRQCHCCHTLCADRRRIKYANAAGEVTGTWVWSSILPGRKYRMGAIPTHLHAQVCHGP